MRWVRTEFIYAGFHYADFHETHSHLIYFCVNLVYWFFQIGLKIRKQGKISYTSSSKISVAPIAPTFTTIIRHCMQTSYTVFHSNWSRNMESRDAIHLCPSIKNDCHWAGFHETHASSTTFCTVLPYHISLQPAKRVVADRRPGHRETDGQGLNIRLFFTR